MSDPFDELAARLQLDSEPSDQAEDLLARCLALPGNQRAGAIEQACDRQPELAGELRHRVAALKAMGIELTDTHGLPEQLGDFRLIELLGGGGMGVVYLAVQCSLQRDVALKLMRPEHVLFANSRARFRREIEAVSRLQHPGIVPIYAVGEEHGLPYFAMELVRGCTLAEVLRAVRDRAPESLSGKDMHAVVAAAAKSPAALAAAGKTRDSLPEGSSFDGSWVEASLRIARQVADALHHAHERGLVHRDVKPSNIALTPDGRALLLDFGLTSTEDAGEMTRTGSAIGTLHYMSPEQLRRARSVDARSDVYSLGVMLYEMLALQVPYRGDDAHEVQRLVFDGQPDAIRPRNRRVGTDVETAVLCAIDREPARRYATAADFSRDLGHLLARRPIEARRPGAMLRARRWFQRHRATGTAVVLVPALLVAAATALFVQERNHSESLARTLDSMREARDRAELENQRATREAETAVGALDFVSGLFGTVPSEQPRSDKPMTAVDILEHGAASIEFAYAGYPLVKARIQAMLGIALARSGEHGRAVELLERACTRWRAEPSREMRPYLANALYWQGASLQHLGRSADARRKLAEALDEWPEGAAGENGRRDTLEALVMVPTGARDGAGTDADVRADLNAVFARADLDARSRAELQARLGYALIVRKRFDEAAGLCELACSVLDVPGAEPDVPFVHLLANFSQARAEQGRVNEALALNLRAFDAAQQLHPPGRLEMGILLMNRAGLRVRLGDLDAGIREYREATRTLSDALEAAHPFALRSLWQLASAASSGGRCAEADEAACEILRRTDGGRERPGDASRGMAHAALARCAELSGDRAAAETHWRECAERLRGIATHRSIRVQALCKLGRLRFEAGALTECGILLGDALELVPEDELGDSDCDLLGELAHFCAVTGREAEARSYASRMEE